VTRAPPFSEFVAQLTAEDDELLKDLKSAENATKQSAEIMQANLDTVGFASRDSATGLRQFSSAADQMSGSSQVATRSVSALGAAASVTGSQTLGAAAQFAAFAAASDELALSLSAVGTTGAAALKVLGPIAITIVAMGAALKVVSDKSKELSDRIKDARALRETTLEPLRNELDRLREEAQVVFGFRTRESAERRQLARVSKTQEEFDLRLKILNTTKDIADVEKRAAERADTERRRRRTERRLALRDFQRQQRREQQAASLEQERLTTERARAREIALSAVSRRERLTAAAQGLLVRTGAAPASSFIKDPIERRIAQLSERLSQKTEPATTGMIELGRVVSPLAGVRAGEALGRQQLTTAEQQKRISQMELEVQREVKGILRDILQATRVGNMGAVAALRLTEAPR
jgi:hypothetical protein